MHSYKKERDTFIDHQSITFGHSNSSTHLLIFVGISKPKLKMQKLVLVAALVALFAVASASPIGLGLGLGVPGYGYIGGLTKLPNLGWGNIASVNSNQNVHGYNLINVERGPVSVRSHQQAQIAPLGVGIIGGGLLG